MSGILNSGGIIVRRGDSFTVNLHFADEEGDVNLRGAQLKMSAAKENGTKVLQKNGVISDADRGLAIIELTSDDTNIDVGEYLADIQIKMPDGQTHTIFPQNINSLAYFIITPQVTE